MKSTSFENKESIQYSSFRLWLQSEFSLRSRRNPHYSLRSFAQLLKIDSSSLSQILSGKRRISKKGVERIFDILQPSPQLRERLTRSAVSKKEQPEFHSIALDAFTVISEWFNYAILELTFTKDFESDPVWIANKLSISVTEVKSAIERLKRLELLEESEGRLRKTHISLTNESNAIAGAAMKHLQRQVLQKALDAIDNTPQEDKDITSMTMAINEKNLLQARQLIKKFRRDLCQFLETGTQTRVYNLGIQLYPISKKGV